MQPGALEMVACTTQRNSLTLESAEGPDLRLGWRRPDPLPRVWASGSSSALQDLGFWEAASPLSRGTWKGLPHLHIPPTWLIIQACKAYLFSAKAFFKIKFQNHGKFQSTPGNEEEPFSFISTSHKSRTLEQAKWRLCNAEVLGHRNPSDPVCSL